MTISDPEKLTGGLGERTRECECLQWDRVCPISQNGSTALRMKCCGAGGDPVL